VFSVSGKTTNVTINLPDPPAAAAATAIQARNPIRGGTAAQSGNDLKVTVSKPTANTVQILDQGAGAIEVEWNGAAVHSFTGVTTILVQAVNAKKDQITFCTPPLM